MKLAASVAAAVALAGVIPSVSAASSSAGTAKSSKVASRAVTFTVRNTNGSALACASDGLTYEVKGHLVGPRSAIGARSRPRAVTLYLHGLALGEWFWSFKQVPGFDYATAQARRGHVSLVIDRLGYDASGHPDGNATCVGAHADIAHQIVAKLRSGDYSVDAGSAPTFKRVALAGHSAGAAIAMLEAHSFKDVDAVIVLSFSFQNRPKAQVEFGQARLVCQAGGQPAEPGGPGGYAYYGQSPADFVSAMFARGRRSVVEAATALRNRDPCGDNASLINALLLQGARVPTIKVPTLVVCGSRDALYSALGCAAQERQFRGSRDASIVIVNGAGHALTLDRSASTFRARVSRWLSKRKL